ncbi:MAG: CinA family nicotinamide mononucleotide deamidase-related protein [Bacteroidota bacterium]
MHSGAASSVSIITIGDELLIGQTVDTNSAWMAMELNKAGFTIKRRVAVGDEWKAIWAALDEESQHAEVILITGGLGPTSDDITKPLLCSYFNGTLVRNEAAHQNVVDIFTRRLNRPLLERNLRQADVPDTCVVIQNKRGTAPGMWFEKNEKIFISMPGVPFEMKGMMTKDVIPGLVKRFNVQAVEHRTLLTAGIGESFLAEKLVEFERTLPKEIKLAYLPNYGMVRLRLSLLQTTLPVSVLEETFIQLQALVSEFLVVNKDITLQEAVAELLISTGKTLAVAESCTGGYIAHLITSIPGSSAFYLGGAVSYSNHLKQSMLHVEASTLAEHGAVSDETVRQMAEGVRLVAGADYGLATSGIMGPTGATPTKDLGLVWVACSSASGTVSTSFQFRFDRKRNIELSAAHALHFLRKNIG